MSRYLYKNFVVMVIADLLLIWAAWYGAHLLRFNFQIPPGQLEALWRLLPLVCGIKILAFFFGDLYQGMWRYTSITDLGNVLKSVTVATAGLILVLVFVHGLGGYSRSVFILDWLLTIVLVGGLRLGIRLFFVWSGQERSGFGHWRGLLWGHKRGRGGARRLLVIGAGDGGEKIYREIQDNPRLGYEVVGFVDDDPGKASLRIHGTPVLGGLDDIKDLVKRVQADELLIAIPSASAAQMRRVVQICEDSRVPYKTVPGIGELIDGRVTVNAIREVSYNDLLGREAVRLEEDRIGACLEGARVLVTGASGSIGSELCRQICRFRPQSLVLFERNESGLYDVDLELRSHFKDVDIVSVLGDVRDRSQLEKAFAGHGPKVVFHAAAYKHVPLMEQHPWKAVKNNIIGTRNVAETAKAFAAERFVLVSTDKAVRPTNVMGASKRVAEQVVLNANQSPGNTTKFMLVRFGNVVGSVGSVVPLFKKQIERGGPVTVEPGGRPLYFNIPLLALFPVSAQGRFRYCLKKVLIRCESDNTPSRTNK